MPPLVWLVITWYLTAVRLDGDYHSDWLTHLPHGLWLFAEVLAHWLIGA